MTNSFIKIFNREPDYIKNSDYFFNTDFDKDLREIIISGKVPWSSVEEYHRIMEEKTVETFFDNWNSRDIILTDSWSQYDFPWICDKEVYTIMHLIAESERPVLDIASSYNLGMAAFIKKISPTLPYLISDMDMSAMSFMSTFLKNALPDYPFFFTSFDNNDIPICDNSLDYITSIDGITSSAKTSRCTQKNLLVYSSGCETAISEVYRILKSGGYFITTEQWWDIIVSTQNYQTEKNLSGIILSLRKNSWERYFSETGFEILIRRDFKKNYPARKFLLQYNKYSEKNSNQIELDSINLNSIEIKHVTTFFVLKK